MAGADGTPRFALIGVGFNEFGQLGPEGSAEAKEPLKLMAFASLPSLYSSSTWDSTHVLAVEGSGTVSSVTRGRWGPLVAPVRRELRAGESVVSITEPHRGTLVALTTTGRVHAVRHSASDSSCRSCSVGVAPHEEVKLVSLAALGGGGACYALTRDGVLFSCETGGGPPGFALGARVSVPTRILSVSCGADHALLLTVTGQVMSFGLGTRGQLGHGDIADRKEPTIVEATDGILMAQIACGLWHSLALSECGDLYSWGWNNNGQVVPCPQINQPLVVSTPMLIDPGAEGGDEFGAISCGARHSAAVTKKGRVYTWGWGYYGQLLDSSAVCHSVVCGHWSTLVLVESPQQGGGNTESGGFGSVFSGRRL